MPGVEPRDRGFHEIQVRFPGLDKPEGSGFIWRQSNPSGRGIAVAETNDAL